jgi:putative heme-binding domain-containing protein
MQNQAALESARALQSIIAPRKSIRHCRDAVGPDLAALTDRTTASLLEAVFDPNRTVDERDQSYVAVTDEGRTYVGILAGETANSITLVGQEGKQHTLLRSELEQLSNSGGSSPSKHFCAPKSARSPF